MGACICCLSNLICVQALISLDGTFVVIRVLVTSQRVVSVEACVSSIKTRFGGAGLDTGCTYPHSVWLDLII